MEDPITAVISQAIRVWPDQFYLIATPFRLPTMAAEAISIREGALSWARIQRLHILLDLA